ncbi:Armadillo/beta-catenin repeat family protein / kinesin motor family protein [Perilla frutescens var. hirtella]|uniref:Armadillo/beta-catenin repeat family protein / kinesin motor family protein n=1 Tax=Perilla frutescens var. hirtella TaxID=608512 RepID=A0AAD4JSJ6_PERFH|nr:Armadillo/beta-catenin repeat family protein / kinesin motor family protein [Perilla frutescens var. hirtella]
MPLESERVRVAVRLRPKNAEDLSDVDHADCVELQPELKRLKLRKNNWSSESYRFDEVFTESASQKRIYEVVAKPVVESVLDGYNGTVMAYGQTGTGKTYTLGRMGKEDVSERGIMVRALEDILAGTSASDNIEVSYFQLYMESIQDLLAPEKTNIPIVEDAKTGEVSVPGAEIVKIRNLDHFLQLLQLGEANRHAANTKMNTESSRSHAILMVYIRRSPHEKEETDEEKGIITGRQGHHVPTIRKSKLLIVDLAGSERIDKSGSEGHLLEEAKFINLSLSSLGKCINALAENSPHIPTRDSKLTRLLRDSFGGSARTSLIITIGPSSRHHAETASTVMFGQRAMKVVNTVKLKEEFDYESLCRKLETQVDHLSAEVDRHQKLRETDKNEMRKLLEEFEKSSAEAQKSFVVSSEENAHLTSKMKELLQELDSQKEQNKVLLDEVARLATILKDIKFLEDENARLELDLNDAMNDLKHQKDQNIILGDEVARLEMNLKHNKQNQLEHSAYQRILADTTQMYEEKIADLMKRIDDENVQNSSAEEDMERMKKQVADFHMLLEQNQVENSRYRKALADTTKMYEERIESLNQQIEDEHAHAREVEEELNLTKKILHEHQNSSKASAEKEMGELLMRLQEVHHLHETTENELRLLSIQNKNLESEKARLRNELHAVRQTLQEEEKQRKEAEAELFNMIKGVPDSEDGFEEKVSYMNENITKSSDLHNPQSSHKSSRSRETILSQRNTITKICEEVGLQKILSLLESGDLDVQTHAVKVVANLAAEDINQERIVQEGGLDALLKLVESSQNTTILRVASGAIANLAMNEMNQGLITNKGGAKLLARAASRTDDPQTLRMVAGAIANLCGNEKLHAVLKEDGSIRALLGMTRSGNTEVIAQVARGLANFSKCESRRIMKGHWRGRSLLMEDGALSWLVANLNTTSTSTRRHLELAICHLAQNEDNARDFIRSGGLKELIEISDESSREDIRNLAKKTLRLSSLFRGDLRAE